MASRVRSSASFSSRKRREGDSSVTRGPGHAVEVPRAIRSFTLAGLDVTGGVAGVLPRRLGARDFRRDALRHRASLPVREGARLRQEHAVGEPDRGNIPDREHAVIARAERCWVDGDTSRRIDESALAHDGGSDVWRHSHEQVERAVLHLEENAWRVAIDAHRDLLPVQLDSVLLEQLDQRRAHVFTGREHRLVLGGVERQLCLLPDAAPAEVGVDQERCFVRRGRTGEGSPADQDDEAAAAELRERALDLHRSLALVEIQRALRQARHRLRRLLRPERDDEVVAGESPGRGLHAPRGGVDRHDFALHDLDLPGGEPRERSLALRRVAALPGHDPQIRHAGREGLTALDHDDSAVRGARQQPQLTGHGQAADAAAEHHHRLRSHCGFWPHIARS